MIDRLVGQLHMSCAVPFSPHVSLTALCWLTWPDQRAFALMFFLVHRAISVISVRDLDSDFTLFYIFLN